MSGPKMPRVFREFRGFRGLVMAVAVVAAGAIVAGQTSGLNPADLLKPLADSWTSYSGDYTGRRYSTLTQVNQSNVKNLTLAFAAKVTGGPGGPGGGGGGRGGPGPEGPQTFTGGEGDGSVTVGGA